MHMVGGFSGLAAAYFMGYRGQFAKDSKFVARFEKTSDGKWVVNDYPSSSDAFVTVGTLLLWFCKSFSELFMIF